MFIKYISNTDLNKVERILDRTGKGCYSLLLEGAYDIFYEYVTSKQTFFYSAWIKDKYKDKAIRAYAPFCLYFGINEKGMLDVSINENNASLIKYVYECEKNLNDESMADHYGDVYEQFELTRGLSPVEAERKINQRKDFESFLSKIDKIKEKTIVEARPQEKCGVRIRMDIDYYFYFGLDLITTTGVHEVNNFTRFVDTFKTGGKYKVSTKESIALESSSFASPYDKAVPLLCNNAIFYSRGRAVMAELRESAFMPLFELLVGEEIIFNGELTKIKEMDPVSVGLGRNGEPVFTPSIDTESGLFQGDKGILVINEQNKKILYYPYGSEVVKQTYTYFRNHKDDNFNYIKDIFTSKLLPKVSSSLKSVAPKGQVAPFVVRLYISFDSQERLAFKTVYEENGAEVKAKDIKTEYGKSLLAAYEALLISLGGVANGHISSQEEIYSFLTKDISSLSKLAQIYFEDRLKGESLSRPGNFHIKVNFSQTYLEMTLDADNFDKEELSSIMIAIKKKKKFILLKDKTILLDDEKLESAAEIFGDGEIERKDVPLYHLFSLQNSAFDVEVDDGGKRVLSDIKNFRESEVSLPSSLTSLLRPYQLDGVKYLSTLSRYGLGGILADEMGLGKTLQTIAYLVSLEESGPILIITPKAVLYNWLSEINRFSTLDATIIDGPKARRESIISSISEKRKHVYLSAYDSFRRDSDELSAFHYSVVILDEAQSVKNAFSQRHIALGKLNSSHRFALTGTPLENSPFDLWSIFDFLMPGYLGSFDSFSKFSAKEGSSTLLASLLKPFTLRRRKDDVLKDLPPKSETDILLQMEDSQRLYYVAFLQKVREQSKIEGESKIAMLAALTRLRQICVDPSSFIEEYDGISSKLSYCRDLILEAKQEGHKVIVFSSFKTALNHLEEILLEENVKLGVITGDTSGKDRLALAKEFNDEKGQIEAMLVSLKAGGVGLNLIGADTVIHLDPWWNPAAESQASDRAHRIGQTRPVTIYRLISKDSIEEKVQILQERKKDLFDEIVEGSGGAGKLTDEDIDFLLS